jgi:hypothetical protein
MGTDSRQVTTNNVNSKSKQTTHSEAVLYTCHWVQLGCQDAHWCLQVIQPTATMLKQRTKRTASLADGRRDYDNAFRRVETLGVPALQDRGRRGRFTDGNNRKGGGKIRIQS